MAAKSDSLELPEHWVLKTSRRWSSMIYYFNTKTGKSSWIHPRHLKEGKASWVHPSLLKEGKSSWIHPSPVKEEKSPKRVEKDKDMLPKTEELNDEPEKEIEKAEANFPESISTNSQTHSESSPLPKRSLITISEDSHAVEEESWNKRKPVTFVIKANKKPRNASEIKKDSSDIKKMPVTIHANILRARKIAEKVKWSKKKDVNVGPQSGKTVPNAPLEKKRLPSSDAKCRKSVEPKEVIAPVNTRKTAKAKRREAAKKKKDERLINSIIKEISSIPNRDDKESTLPVKFKKVVKRDKNNDFDVHKKFLKSEEESPPPIKPVVKTKHNSKEARMPPCDEPVPKQISRNQLDAESKYDEVTEMEVEEHEIISEIANFRGSVSHSRQTDSSQLQTSTINSSSNSLYFVVDTNVLIQDIRFLEKLKMKEINGKKIVIVIPYTALQEMDGLKRKESIGKACQTAICWCNGHFEKSDPRVQGQSYDNYLKTVAEKQGSSGDDLIRDCCLLLKKEGLDVCLLTNDVNLRNKAFMAAISAVSVRVLKVKLEEESRKIAPSDISNNAFEDNDSRMYSSSASGFELDSRVNFNKSTGEYPQLEKMICDITPKHYKKSVPPRQRGEIKLLRKNIKSSGPNCSEDEKLFKEISNSLHHTLGQILEFIMKDIYEDIWLKIVKHKPPWSITEVFSCWEKHWIAVMSDRFPRELKELLIEIKHALGDCKRGRGDATTLKEKVQILYCFFKSKPYHDYILPIDGQSSQTVISEVPDLNSVSPSVDKVRESNTVERLANDSEDSTTKQIASSGMANIERMINLVGLHITHFIALILDAYEVAHSLPTLNSSSKMTREDARGSGINLHKVTVRLGTAIVRCMNEATSDSLQELGNLLVSFWAEAKEPCPNLPFTEENLAHFVMSSSGQHFLKLTVGELEKLLTTLMSVVESQ